MELILVRHGETDANRQGILMGSIGGPSLNDTGRAQAAEIGEALKAEPVVHLYTSPAWRARETAEIISQTVAVPFSEVDDLREIDVGRLEGLTQAEVWENFGAHSLEWERDPATARHPGGETLEELQARAWNVVQELSAKHPYETVVVVSHLFAILAIVTVVLEMPLRHFRRIRLEPGAMARIDMGTGSPQVTSTNETWHLRTRGRDAWRTVNSPDGAG
ncbi:MAG: histidine phosphatase family protein [Chloroflexota bacterium]|nr:histidine phosphatase family protein [Chloroflexota bacterium]